MIDRWNTLENYKCSINDCSNDLAELLTSGQLALFLGSGISKPLGLPNWIELVNLCNKIKPNRPDVDQIASFDDLTIEMEEVRSHINNDAQYFEHVRKKLYPSKNLGSPQKWDDKFIAIVSTILMTHHGLNQELNNYCIPYRQELIQILNECSQQRTQNLTVSHESTHEDLSACIRKIYETFSDSNDFLNFIEQISLNVLEERNNNSVPRLLQAIGTLLIGSQRGSVKEVITFNFDCCLEWYLKLHGYVTQSVTTLPVLTGSSDVTIYHPHGFLPIDNEIYGSNSDFLIFDLLSYEERNSKKVGEDWINCMEHIAKSKVILAIGISTTDKAITQFLTSLKDTFPDHRPTAFWLLGPADSEKDENILLGRNCVPIKFDSYDDFPNFIFDIARRASKKI